MIMVEALEERIKGKLAFVFAHNYNGGRGAWFGINYRLAFKCGLMTEGVSHN